MDSVMPADPVNEGDNDSLEANTHAFIVKIWLEETLETDGRARWRGHITHAMSRRRRYLHDLNDILTFIKPYLADLGIKMDWRWRMRRWLKDLSSTNMGKH